MKRRRARPKRRKTTRRRTRRRNPAASTAAQLLMAGAGGAIIGGARFLADGMDMPPPWKEILTIGVGAVGSVAIKTLAPSMGYVAAGVAGAGFGIGAHGLLTQYVAPPFESNGGTTTKGLSAVRVRLQNQGDRVRMAMLRDRRLQLGCPSGTTCAGCQSLGNCLNGLGAVRPMLQKDPRRHVNGPAPSWSGIRKGMA